MTKVFLVVFLTVVAMSTTIGLTQSVEERAGQLKTWREQCNHPDPDIRLAYLEASLGLGDASIERICVRLALKSDNADIRNLGLRAAIAGIDQLTFDVKIPPQLAQALEKAGTDQSEIRDISKWYITRDFNTIQNGLVFVVKNADVTTNVSIWHPLGSRSTADDNYKGKATIVGDRVRWIGSASLARNWTCTLNVGLSDDGRLEGDFQCSDHWPIPVSAPLL